MIEWEITLELGMKIEFREKTKINHMSLKLFSFCISNFTSDKFATFYLIVSQPNWFCGLTSETKGGDNALTTQATGKKKKKKKKKTNVTSARRALTYRRGVVTAAGLRSLRLFLLQTFDIFS